MGDFGNGIPGNPPSYPTPSPLGGALQDIFNYIGGVFSVLLALIRWVWGWVRYLVQALILLFHRLSKFLLHIWQQYVKRAIQWLAVHVQKLRVWLKRTIGPIIKRLEKIKKWYDTHILKQQLRMLQFLQSIRRFLGILRLFHVKWAAQLDSTLADLQNRIEVSIAIVRGTLNQIISTLAIAFDPSLLITRNVLGASLLSNLGAVKRIFGFGDNRILSASEQATIDRDHSRYFQSNVTAHITSLASTGPTAEDNARRTEFRKALSETTGATLPL